MPQRLGRRHVAMAGWRCRLCSCLKSPMTLRLEQTVPMVAVEALLAKWVVERFDGPVVARRAGRNVGLPTFPSQNRCRAWENQLEPVVHPLHSRLAAPLR